MTRFFGLALALAKKAGRFPRDESRGYDCFGWPAPAPDVGVRSDKRLTIAVTPFAHIYVAHPWQDWIFRLSLARGQRRKIQSCHGCATNL